MKKVLFTIAILFFAVHITNAQCMKQGCMISIHTVEYTPHYENEISKLLNFLEIKLYPTFAKALNCEIKIVKGLNRENKGKLGVIYYYTSKNHFNKFWNDDGSPTEEGQKALDSIQPLLLEFKEIGSSNTTVIQDWLIK